MKPIYVYVAVSIASFIFSNVWIMRRNNSFESELIDKYDVMIKSLRNEFSLQKGTKTNAPFIVSFKIKLVVINRFTRFHPSRRT